MIEEHLADCVPSDPRIAALEAPYLRRLYGGDIEPRTITRLASALLDSSYSGEVLLTSATVLASAAAFHLDEVARHSALDGLRHAFARVCTDVCTSPRFSAHDIDPELLAITLSSTRLLRSRLIARFLECLSRFTRQQWRDIPDRDFSNLAAQSLNVMLSQSDLWAVVDPAVLIEAPHQVRHWWHNAANGSRIPEEMLSMNYALLRLAFNRDTRTKRFSYRARVLADAIAAVAAHSRQIGKVRSIAWWLLCQLRQPVPAASGNRCKLCCPVLENYTRVALSDALMNLVTFGAEDNLSVRVAVLHGLIANLLSTVSDVRDRSWEGLMQIAAQSPAWFCREDIRTHLLAVARGGFSQSVIRIFEYTTLNFAEGLSDRAAKAPAWMDEMKQCANLSGGRGVARYITYFLHSAGLEQRGDLALNSEFRHHAAIRQHLGKGRKRVLIIGNCSEPFGDEFIKKTTLLSGLLEYNPLLEVMLLTFPTFPYDHPRVHVASAKCKRAVQLVAAELGEYDMVVDQFAGSGVPNDPLDVLSRKAAANRPPVFLKWPDPRVEARLSKCSVLETRGPGGSRSVELEGGIENVYDAGYRLAAELGLPLVMAGQRSAGLLIGRGNAEADTWWQEQIRPNAYANGRRTVALNPFGGRNETKGYRREEGGALAILIEELIQDGFFVILLPNDQRWGSPEVAARVAGLVAPELRKFVVIAPDLQRHARLQKYIYAKVDHCVSVEGGGAHIAAALGKPLTVLLKEGSGRVARWFPYARRAGQHVESITRRLPMRSGLVRHEPEATESDRTLK